MIAIRRLLLPVAVVLSLSSCSDDSTSPSDSVTGEWFGETSTVSGRFALTLNLQQTSEGVGGNGAYIEGAFNGITFVESGSYQARQLSLTFAPGSHLVSYTATSASGGALGGTLTLTNPARTVQGFTIVRQ